MFDKQGLLERLNARPPGRTAAFGLLAYGTANLGDDIQSLAALGFLPHVHQYVERDSIGATASDQRLKLIMNAWFMGRPSWPPSACVDPLFVAFHMASHRYPEYGGEDPSTWMCSDASIEYLKRFEPIGCRDLDTVAQLEQRGVACYFSGCLTLTFGPTPASQERREILFVDPKAHVPSLFASVPPHRRADVALITHATDIRYAPQMRMHLAAELLRRYSQAHLVITSRLHCLLPCLAFGTPVLFVPPGTDAGRLSGYEDGFFNSLQTHDWEVTTPINWERPDPNPGEHLRLAASLTATVEKFVAGAAREGGDR
jgi:hypothetical protein